MFPFTSLIDRQGATALAWAILVCAVSFAYAASNPLWVPDDFGWHVGNWHVRAVDKHGRWALRLWGEITNWNPMPSFSWAIATLAYPLSGLLLARYWDVRGTLATTLVAVLFVSYPGFIEEARWDLVVAPFALAHLTVVASLLFARRSTLAAVLAGGALTVAIAVYQTLATFAAVAVLFHLALSAANTGFSGLATDFRRLVLRPLIAGVTGVLCYALSLGLYAHTGRGLGRGLDDGLAGNQDTLARLGEGIGRLLDTLASGLDDLHGALLVPLAMMLALFSAAAALRDMRRAPALLLGIGLATVATVAIYTHQYLAPDIQESGWSTRAATGFGLLLPFLAALSLRPDSRHGRLHQATVLVFCLLVINWLAYAGGASYRWHLETMRVATDASRILERVQSQPGYRMGMPIVFPYGYDYAWYRFDAGRTSTEFLQFFDRRTPPPSPQDIRLAQQRAENLGYWPGPDSVKIFDDMAVVVVATPLGDALRAGQRLSPGALWRSEAAEPGEN